jgi:hypothetical protein
MRMSSNASASPTATERSLRNLVATAGTISWTAKRGRRRVDRQCRQRHLHLQRRAGQRRHRRGLRRQRRGRGRLVAVRRLRHHRARRHIHQIGASNQWQIHSGLDGHNETVIFSNGAVIDPHRLPVYVRTATARLLSAHCDGERLPSDVELEIGEAEVQKFPIKTAPNYLHCVTDRWCAAGADRFRVALYHSHGFCRKSSKKFSAGRSPAASLSYGAGVSLAPSAAALNSTPFTADAHRRAGATFEKDQDNGCHRIF